MYVIARRGSSKMMDVINNDKRCEVCCDEVFKYKCPRCTRQTCSVKCVKAHKTAEGCSGQREKSAFVAINQYTENHLLSDYRFLEDVDRAADNAARNSKKFPHKNHNNKKFLKRAADRKGVQLLLLPNVFTKHKRNSSRTFKESPNTIFWCVNWKYPQSDYAEILERKISDKLTFNNVLKKYIHTTESNPIHRQRLQCYLSDDIDNVNIYMEYDRSLQQNKKYYKLDLHKSIEENLKGKLVIEYPTIHVVLKSDISKYETKVLTGDPAKEHTDILQRRINAIGEVISMEEGQCRVESQDEEGSAQCETINENITCGLMEDEEGVSLACGLKEKQEEESVQDEGTEIKEEDIITSELMVELEEESLVCNLMEKQEEESVQDEGTEIKEDDTTGIINREEGGLVCRIEKQEEKSVKGEGTEIREEDIKCGLLVEQDDSATGVDEGQGKKERRVKETSQYGAQGSHDMEESHDMERYVGHDMEGVDDMKGHDMEEGHDMEGPVGHMDKCQKSHDMEEGQQRHEEVTEKYEVKCNEAVPDMEQKEHDIDLENQNRSVEPEEGECSDDDELMKPKTI